jgi:uncharacterized protein (TIGR02001 family)
MSFNQGDLMKYRNTSWSIAAACMLVLSGVVALPAVAAEEQAEHSVSYNAAVVTDYRYRGLSQSRRDPALQGGADYTHNPSGLYAGTWLSSIKWTKDLGGDGNVEWDLYGGKRGELGAVSYDVGGLYYYYPSNGLRPNANTFELYGQLGYGPVFVKYSHATTNLFGTPDSKQSGYLDIFANVPISYGLVLNLHAGRQRVRHNGNLSYTDYKVGLTKDFGIASVTLVAIRADTEAYLSPTGRNLGKTSAVLAVTKTF